MVKAPVPIWRVEMRVAYATEQQQRQGKMFADMHKIQLLAVHDPSKAWDAGKWEIAIEAYVGGDRRLEYPDERKFRL